MYILTNRLKHLTHSLVIRNVRSHQVKPARLQSSSLKQYKLDTPQYHKLLSKDLKYVHEIFKEKKYELRIAGGAVRDLLMNMTPHDVDLATDAMPQQMLELFEEKNVQVFNKNGIKHGTVSVRIKDRVIREFFFQKIEI